jgi:hypothetical protein
MAARYDSTVDDGVKGAWERLRYVAGRVTGAPMIAYFLFATRPRRRPSLKKFVGGAKFRERHDAVAGWIEGHFRLIEARAPWLVRIGVLVDEACWASQPMRGWVTLHRDPYVVMCTREVCAVYGADGDLVTSVRELGAVLYSAGWGYHSYPDPRGQLSAVLAATGEAHPDWQPRDDVPRPLGYLEPGDPDAAWTSLSMLVRAERGHPPAAWPGLRDVPRRDAYPPTPLHYPVEISGEDVRDLASRALEEHDHAFLIEVRITY